jgi:ATP-dependent DNA ligase
MANPSEFAHRYKRAVASRYRALGPADLAELPSGKLWVSPKIDGELWVAVLDGGSATLTNPSGRMLEGAPVCADLADVAKRVKGRTVLVGELFAAGGKPRPRVGDVTSVLADGGKALDRLGWQCFDALEVDGTAAPASYGERIASIQALLEGGKRAVAIKTVETSDRAEVQARWDEWGASGKAEGIVVRSEDGRVFKVKPTFTVDAVVLGFTTRSEAQDEARSLLLGLVRSDGAFQLVGGAANLGSDEQRRALLKLLAPYEAESKFRHTSGDGALYRWVKPEVVVEIACTDVQTEDAEGHPVERWTLRYDAAGGWNALCALPGASLLHPTVVRVRADKKADGVDARISQVTERCALADLDRPAKPVELPTSQLVRRDVWTKVTKGKTAVRKILVWKTNKETAVEGWPSFVVHFTDYSPDRKTPLERTVKTATSEASARELADALVDENIKKGWEPAARGAEH